MMGKTNRTTISASEKLGGIITGAMTTAPITALRAVINIEPLHLKLKTEESKAWIKMKEINW